VDKKHKVEYKKRYLAGYTAGWILHFVKIFGRENLNKLLRYVLPAIDDVQIFTFRDVTRWIEKRLKKQGITNVYVYEYY
jgi:hypothetical protein